MCSPRVLLILSDIIEKFRVNRPHGQINVILIQKNGNANFRGVDHLNVDSGLIQRLEHTGRHAAVGHKTRADDGNLSNMAVGFDMVKAQSLLVFIQDAFGIFKVLFMNGKGNILGILAADGLKNDVHH